MKSIKNGAFAVGLSMSAVACGGSSPESAPVSIEQAWLDPTDGEGELSQAADSEQVRFTQEALAAAKNVAQSTGNQQALNVYEFLDQHVEPARLTSLGPVAVSNTFSLEDGDVFLLGVSQEDMGINAISDFYASAPAHGVYSDELNSMFLYPDSGIKDKWLGIITLHEGNHAYNHATGSYSPFDEVLARNLEHDLASAVFGQPYEQLVTKAMDDMRQAFSDSYYYGTSMDLPAIDITPITTADSSEQEKRMANTSVLMNAIFRLTDEMGIGSLEQKQILFDHLSGQMQVK